MSTPAPAPSLSTDQRLRLRPGLLLKTQDSPQHTETLLQFDSRVLRLKGQGARALLGLMDGTRTLHQVCEAVRPEQRPGALALVQSLERYDLLDRSTEMDTRWAPTIQALELLGADGPASVRALRQGQVTLVGGGELGQQVAEALQSHGFSEPQRQSLEQLDAHSELSSPASKAASSSNISSSGNTASSGNTVTLALISGEDSAALETVNRWSLNHEAPCLYLTTWGFRVRLGPFVVPRQTACYTCLQRRLRANAEHSAQQPLGLNDALSGTVQIAAQAAALEMLRFFAVGLEPTLFDHVVDYDFAQHTAERRRVLKVPRCPACGNLENQPAVRSWMETWRA